MFNFLRFKKDEFKEKSSDKYKNIFESTEIEYSPEVLTYLRETAEEVGLDNILAEFNGKNLTFQQVIDEVSAKTLLGEKIYLMWELKYNLFCKEKNK